MQSVHIKITARNSIRRFAITHTNLSALRQTVANLFGLALENSESLWTIKYKDEENELITVTRDDELEFAIKLMGNLLHLVVVEHGPAVAAALCHAREWQKRRHQRDERDGTELKGDHVCRNRLVCLQRKQRKFTERLAFLQQNDNPRAQAQALKIKQKLAVITSEIESINSAESVTPAENAEALKSPDADPVAANQLTVVTPLGSNAAPVPAPLDAKAVKLVYDKFFAMRRDFVSEKKKVTSLVEVLRALRALSKHGEKASCPVKVDNEQLAVAQSSLTVARENLVAKKLEVKQQGDLVRTLKKQGLKPPKEGNREKKAWQEEKWKAKLEEKESKQEAKKKWQEEKAKLREEKIKRQEEKAKEREEKLKKQAEKAKEREEKLKRQAEKAKEREEKLKHQAEKARLREEIAAKQEQVDLQHAVVDSQAN